MEENNQNLDKLYIEGFNSGYLLAKYEPSLSAKLTIHENSQSDFFLGVVGGKNQYEKEVREMTMTSSKKSPRKEDRDIEFER